MVVSDFVHSRNSVGAGLTSDRATGSENATGGRCQRRWQIALQKRDTTPAFHFRIRNWRRRDQGTGVWMAGRANEVAGGRIFHHTVWDNRVGQPRRRPRGQGAAFRGKSYVLLLDMGGRSKRVSLVPVGVKSLEDIRRQCHARRADPEPEGKAGPACPVPLFRDFVAGPWKEAHFDGYKPSTRRGIRYQLAGQLPPAFGSKPLDRIGEAGIRRWFDRYSRTAPGNANLTLARLRQMLNFAVACGHIESNPAQGIAFNRRPKLTRFLSREEVARLHRVLDGQTRKESRPQADIIRLLLLTGCRQGEIVNLRWAEVHGDMLSLGDSKTGPRTVPLNSQARRILDRQPRTGSPFVFPSPRDASRPRRPDLALWDRVRKEAGIEDCRLHDLRHTCAISPYRLAA